MKKLIFLVLVSFWITSCTKEEIESSVQSFSEEEKTSIIILNNIPENFVGDSVYIFTLDNAGEFFSAIQATAREDAAVSSPTPPGNASFTIISYIPTVKNWNLDSGFVDGWYSTIAGAMNRTGRYVISQWENQDSYDNSSQTGSSDVLDVDLTITGYDNVDKKEAKQGNILQFTAAVSSNLPLADITSVEFLIDSTVIQTLTEEPYTINFNTIDLEKGQYTISVVATNADGDMASDSDEVVITVDVNEAPNVNITGLSNNQQYIRQSVITINSNVTDANGADDIDRVEFRINNSLVSTVTREDVEGGDTYTYEWDTSENDLGGVTVQVTAFDEQGAERSDYVNVTLIEPIIIL